MLVVLSFCHLDRDQARKSLEWIAELDGGANHELLLAWSMTVQRQGGCQDVLDAARRAFRTVFEFPLFDEDERGHPMSANHAWLACARKVEDPNPRNPPSPQPWLWIEPDAVLLTKTGFDQIEAEYKLRDRAFMGDVIPENAARGVQRRPSGVGVYPWNVIYLGSGKVMHLDRRAWDDFFAEDILPFHFQTPLIQDMYCMSRDPDVEPTFPFAGSLELISQDAVLFHRNSDGTLIDRLRESRGGKVGTQEAHILPRAGSTPAPVIAPDATALLLAKIAELEQKLTMQQSVPALKRDARTPEQIEAAKARMAKARAGRGKQKGKK